MASTDAPVALSDSRCLISFDADESSKGTTVRAITLPPDMPWPARWAAIDKAIRHRGHEPALSSSPTTTWLLAMCLASLLENTEYPNYELIVVDNASTDGTVEELQRLAGSVPNVRVILNDHNAGFGPGNNQGLPPPPATSSSSEQRHRRSPRMADATGAASRRSPIGLIGPATNRSCNEAQIDIPTRRTASSRRWRAPRVSGTRESATRSACR